MRFGIEDTGCYVLLHLMRDIEDEIYGYMTRSGEVFLVLKNLDKSNSRQLSHLMGKVKEQTT